MRMRFVAVALFAASLGLATLAQGLQGAYRLVQDSDGTKPKAGAVITLILKGDGSLSLRAVQPGQVFEDSGQYSVAGSLVSLSFRSLNKRVTAQPYSLAGSILTLPFKMLSDGPGASSWRSELTPSTPSPVATAPAGDLSELLASTLDEARHQDNASQRREMDARAAQRQGAYRGGAAQVYYAQGVILFLKGYYYEAWYGFAKAASSAPQNAVYLNDLANVLMELDKMQEARAILQWVTLHYPNLDSPFGNLGVCELKLGELDAALQALDRAMLLAPENGLYPYAYGKVLAAKGRKEEAKRYYLLAWRNGYGGSGKEGQGGGTGGQGGSPGGPGGSGETGGTGGPGGPSASGGTGHGAGRGAVTPPGNRDRIPAEWVGHYEAKYVRAKSSDVSTFGQSLAQTAIKTDTLCCAKSFSMDIDASGGITGRGRLLYVYLGTAVNPAMGLMPGFAVAGAGGFSATLKNGSQERDWSFSGRVSPDGTVEVSGLPSEKLDFLNVGKWQKISCWSPLPPPDRSRMRGPFRMTLADEEKGVPSIYVNQWLQLNDRLIHRVHYEAYIFRSDKPVTPDCKVIEPPKAKCPASEYLKTTCSVGPDGAFTVSASRDLGTGEVSTQTSAGGDITGGAGVDSGGNITFSGSMGNATGSMQFNPTDGSYSVSMGMGIDTSSVVPGPFKITQKIELVYDSRCGWGIKGTAGASAGVASAGVEGCVFFNKGV